MTVDHNIKKRMVVSRGEGRMSREEVSGDGALSLLHVGAVTCCWVTIDEEVLEEVRE
jgi:hypothetical protein